VTKRKAKRYIVKRTEQGLRDPKCSGPLNRPERLTNRVRVVIGLDNMGVDLASEMADILRLVVPPTLPDDAPPGSQRERLRMIGSARKRRDEFLDLAAKVLRSRHPVVAECLLYGLPKACPGLLPQGSSIRCEQCGGACNSVPCVKCSKPKFNRNGELSSGYEYDFRGNLLVIDPDDKDDKPLLAPPEAAEALPGTAEKIAIMRARLERGESCFHEDDPRLVHQTMRGDAFYGVFRTQGDVVAGDGDDGDDVD
jgi:hypothetical protein